MKYKIIPQLFAILLRNFSVFHSATFRCFTPQLFVFGIWVRVGSARQAKSFSAIRIIFPIFAPNNDQINRQTEKRNK